MDQPLIFIIGLFVVGMGFSLWALLRPDSWMRVDRASWGWMFRGGRDLELSDSGRAWIRFRGVIGIGATLLACGMLFSLWSDDRARDEATEQRAQRDATLDDVAEAWGTIHSFGGGLRIVLPTVGPAAPALTPADLAATVAGYQPVTRDGAEPAYLAELPLFEDDSSPSGSSLVTGESARALALESVDLVVGTTSMCDVGEIAAVYEDDRVVLDVVYAETAAYGVALDCVKDSVGSVTLTPVRLPGPVGDRAVQLVDGTAVREIHTP